MIIESFGFLFLKKPILLAFLYKLANRNWLLLRVAKLKLSASISATDAKPRTLAASKPRHL